MRIDSDTNIDGTPTTAGRFSVVALASQFASTPPFDSGYQILPRSLSDIVVTGAASLAAAPPPWTSAASPSAARRSTVTVTNVGLSPITLTPPFGIAGSGGVEFAVGHAGHDALPRRGDDGVRDVCAGDSGRKSAALNIRARAAAAPPAG